MKALAACSVPSGHDPANRFAANLDLCQPRRVTSATAASYACALSSVSRSDRGPAVASSLGSAIYPELIML